MGLWSLFVVASMPIVEFLLIGFLGAFLASEYINILTDSARRDINKVTFVVFNPSVVFASLVKTVTLQELISWWYMPVNIAITFLIGGFLGWLTVRILKPDHHLEGLIIGSCSAGNLGYLPLIIVPAICNEPDSPFGEASICRVRGLSFVSLSMSLSSVFIWTHTYNLMRKSGILFNKIRNEGMRSETSNNNLEVSTQAHLVKMQGEGNSNDQGISIHPSIKWADDITEHEKIVPLLARSDLSGNDGNFWVKLRANLNKFVDELLAPPTIATIVGIFVGVIPWLKSLIIGSTAPLRVIEDTITTLGDGVLPCITLILGGNLIQGLRKPSLKPLLIIMICFVRYVILPLAGIALVKAASKLRFLPQDPLYHYVLMLQFALPPATNIGSMAQLFDVAKEECSVIFLWTYLVAAVALTIWSTVFMWLLS